MIALAGLAILHGSIAALFIDARLRVWRVREPDVRLGLRLLALVVPFLTPAYAVLGHDTRSGAPCLSVAADRYGDQTRAARALPAVTTLQTSQVAIAGRVTDVERVMVASGAVWLQARWRAPRTAVIRRYRGNLDDLLGLVERTGTGEPR